MSLVKFKDYIKPYHRKSKLEDVVELYPILREADQREVETLGSSPEKALVFAYLNSSTCRTIINSMGNPVAMFGVVPLDKYVGSVWMLGSNGLPKIKKAFLKECRQEVIKLNEKHPYLCNIIDSRNTLHVKWIRWCGFKIIGETMINNVKFYEFCRVGT